MAEALEEQASQPFDLERLIDLARRRHLPFLILVFVGWCAVWGASWFLQPRYKSTTLILVEQPTMPKDYVTPNVSDNLQDRLQSITQQILSRTRLLLIIDKLHLYRDAKIQRSLDERVVQMRKDIDIELVRNPQDEISAFRVSYSAGDPWTAQNVTRELTNLFINENLQTRQQQSQDTTSFLQSQLDVARASLSEQEAKVRTFQTAHVGSLPSQQASNLQILSGLQSQLQNEQDALNTARQQRVYYESLIEQNRDLPRPLKTSGTSPVASPLDLINQELAKENANLSDLRSRYTERYPEVQALEVQIARTEQEREKLLSDAKHRMNASEKPGKDTVGNEGPDVAQNSAMLQLQGQLKANQLEVGNRERSIAELKARIDEYQTRLNSEPAVEQQLADLTRGYNQSKADFDDLLKKKNESAMATNMEQMQEGERFKILDPPSLPLRPDSPNRLKFCGIGLAVGLALGVALVFALEFMDDRMHREKEIKALLSMPILAEIPRVTNPTDQRSRKIRMAFGWTTAALVASAILAGSAFSFLHS